MQLCAPELLSQVPDMPGVTSVWEMTSLESTGSWRSTVSAAKMKSQGSARCAEHPQRPGHFCLSCSSPPLGAQSIYAAHQPRCAFIQHIRYPDLPTPATSLDCPKSERSIGDTACPASSLSPFSLCTLWLHWPHGKHPSSSH